LQPKSRTIRYDNVKSAMAEETVIAMVLKVPALLEQAKHLKPSHFSSSLLGRVYEQLQSRYAQGLEVSVGVLMDLTAEEMSHVAAIVQRQQGPVNENALNDCIKTIVAEHQSANVSSENDLLAYQKKLRESKGVKA
jgi:DNA primase